MSSQSLYKVSIPIPCHVKLTNSSLLGVEYLDEF